MPAAFNVDIWNTKFNGNKFNSFRDKTCRRTDNLLIVCSLYFVQITHK